MSTIALLQKRITERLTDKLTELDKLILSGKLLTYEQYVAHCCERRALITATDCVDEELQRISKNGEIA